MVCGHYLGHPFTGTMGHVEHGTLAGTLNVAIELDEPMETAPDIRVTTLWLANVNVATGMCAHGYSHYTLSPDCIGQLKAYVLAFCG